MVFSVSLISKSINREVVHHGIFLKQKCAKFEQKHRNYDIHLTIRNLINFCKKKTNQVSVIITARDRKRRFDNRTNIYNLLALSKKTYTHSLKLKKYMDGKIGEANVTHVFVGGTCREASFPMWACYQCYSQCKFELVVRIFLYMCWSLEWKKILFTAFYYYNISHTSTQFVQRSICVECRPLLLESVM